MTEEQKQTAPPEETTEPTPVKERAEEPEEKAAHAPDEAPHRGNALAEKRGRMVSAGILSAVILALIVVLVAGIFQVSTWVLMKCPQDLQVNDPAPKLWEKMEASRLGDQSIGLADNLLAQTALKAGGQSAEGSTEEDSAEKPK